MPYDEFEQFYWSPEEAMQVFSDLERSGEIPSRESGASSKRPALLDILNRYHYDPNQVIIAETTQSPVYIQLDEPGIGPILISGPEGSGKTEFLQAIAKSVNLCHSADRVKFGVLTNYPKEWEEFKKIPNCLDISPLYANSSQEFLLGLASWARSNNSIWGSVILLIDDLKAATNLDFEDRQTLCWLQIYGPAKGVWPIITGNITQENIYNLRPWLDRFTTTIESTAPFTFVLKNSAGTSAPFMVPTL